MKITDLHLQSISVKQGRETSALFNDLRPGDRITAQIIKSEGTSALLEFRGRRITADFIAGVPAGSSVELILSEKTPDRIAFTIAGKSVSDEFIKLLLSMTILPKSGFDELSLHNLMKFLGNGKVDLYSLNLFLTGIRREGKEGKSQAELFNSLLKKGISFNTLADLSQIFAGRGGASILAAYYMFADSGMKKMRSLREENLDGKIDDICRNLTDDEDAFTDILNFLIDSDSSESGFGDIALPEGDAFSRLRYIKQEGGFFFDMEFSALGRVSASVKGDKIGTFISIFSDNDDVIDFFRDRVDILKKNLELLDVKKPLIMLHNSKKMIDKLDIWRTDFYIKRDFDVKV
jgi:hypothetical protein